MRARLGGVAAVAAVAIAMSAGAAAAAPVTLCMKPGQPVVAPDTGGACATGYTATQTASQVDIAQVQALLAGVTRSVVNGTKTIRFSGVNVQIDNGAGGTSARNGAGNLIVGYNESPGSQTGSHNVILGTGQTVTGVGGIVGGASNTYSGAFGMALGQLNTVSGSYATAAGGARNTVKGARSTVTGGFHNTVAEQYGSITGGCANLIETETALQSPAVASCEASASPALFSSISGGYRNLISTSRATIAGGVGNAVIERDAVIVGGEGNFVNKGGRGAVIVGGAYNVAQSFDGAVLGGCANTVSDDRGAPNSTMPWCSRVGEMPRTKGEYAAIVGGESNLTEDGPLGIVVGGSRNSAFGHAAAVLGGESIASTAANATYPAGP